MREQLLETISCILYYLFVVVGQYSRMVAHCIDRCHYQLGSLNKRWQLDLTHMLRQTQHLLLVCSVDMQNMHNQPLKKKQYKIIVSGVLAIELVLHILRMFFKSNVWWWNRKFTINQINFFLFCFHHWNSVDQYNVKLCIALTLTEQLNIMLLYRNAGQCLPKCRLDKTKRKL